MKHTPGTWYKTGSNIASKMDDIDGNIRQTNIAEIVFHRPGGNPEDHKNHNLLTAAPDMITELEWIVEYFNEHPQYAKFFFGDGDTAESCWFNRVKDVITKATK